MFKIIRVKGNSLSPEFDEGDFVMVATIGWRGLRNPFVLNPIKNGDVLVFQHAAYGTMIKKFDHYEGDQLYVIGTHQHSVDSSQFGPISKEDLIGKVIWHIQKPRK